VLRHVDAGYEAAIAEAEASGLHVPMGARTSGAANANEGDEGTAADEGDD
jgi:hypothetical protein